MNDTVFESEFGETNDWAKSPIRKRLNKFDKNGNSKVLPDINKSDLVSVSLNYTAYKLPNGRAKDFLTILSYEEYLVYSFPNVSKYTWLRSGFHDGPRDADALDAGGASSYGYAWNWLTVRPALHFKKDLEIEQ